MTHDLKTLPEPVQEALSEVHAWAMDEESDSLLSAHNTLTAHVTDTRYSPERVALLDALRAECAEWMEPQVGTDGEDWAVWQRIKPTLEALAAYDRTHGIGGGE